MSEPAKLPEPESNQIRMRIFGPDKSAATIGGMVSAFGKLADSVADEITGEPGAVKWNLVDYRIVCDGCARDRPAEHGDWVYDEATGFDLCPECQP